MKRTRADQRDMAALAWTGIVGGSTIFKLIPIGGRFRFSGPEVFTKTSERGWYTDGEGNKFQTGTRTAVNPEE